ncbi:TIGR04104 family putative zinc finger protein [Paenibacillus tarimensis]|uniref:TIGR04104 family putative zinc finger protein n=1 Tax=Paenibacillus tarimensis TaxID=416012 RepID=UPI001F3869A9|nr:TIGR04104 family putative zinc finger protein [Paenibacillus tarimensis]MCF2946084.1 hypothetical protein [Paenibacillus tarimensis]
MPKCNNCGRRFGYSHVLKTVSALSGYRSMVCPACQHAHTITLASRFAVSLLVVVFPLLIRMMFFPEQPLPETLALVLLIAVCALFFTPLLVKVEK